MSKPPVTRTLGPVQNRTAESMGTITHEDLLDAGAPERDARLGIDHTRRWTFATGAAFALAITLAAFVILQPLTAARSDLRRITTIGIPAMDSLLDLRTTVVEWQIFIETNISALAPGAVPLSTDLARGSQLVQTQTDQEKALSGRLRGMNRADDAKQLDGAMTTLTRSVTDLLPIASGKTVSTARRAQLVTAERAAFEQVWTIANSLGRALSVDVTDASAIAAGDHLRSARAMFLVAAVAAAVLVAIIALVFGLRAGRREARRRDESLRLAHEVRLQKALDMTTSEATVYGILGASLQASAPRLQVEMLIADSPRATFARAVSTAGDFEGCAVSSSDDCPAATGGQPLFFPSNHDLDACPYLKNRATACSASCFPVSIAGHTVGVMHAVGADHALPTADEITTLQLAARRGTDRIAMLRAFASSEEARIDPLTGLLNRRTLEGRVSDIEVRGEPYTLAYGGVDDFLALNDTHGHETADQLLRLFARVLRDSLRPDDLAARSADAEFLVVLPDASTDIAVGILERVREHLALALAGGRFPAFTVTFGVASTEYASNFEEVVAVADGALLEARMAGHNRVRVASFPDPAGATVGTAG